MPTSPNPTSPPRQATDTAERVIAKLQKQLDHHGGISMQHQLALKKAQNKLVRINTDMKLLMAAIEKLDAMTDKSREAFACAHIKRANIELDYNHWSTMKLQHEAGIQEHGLKMGELRKEIYAAEEMRQPKMEE